MARPCPALPSVYLANAPDERSITLVVAEFSSPTVSTIAPNRWLEAIRYALPILACTMEGADVMIV
jgi:hypothetical protein